LKVLITGGLGQLGRALVETAPKDADITAVDLVDFDLTDPEAVAGNVSRVAPQLIINTAAYTAVDKAESEPEAAFRGNRDVVRNLAQAAVENRARLIQISTDFVFDGAASRPIPPDAPTAPRSVYGASKLAGETEALAAPGALIVRTAWLYSPGGQNFVRTMVRLFTERGGARVIADQVGTPTSAASLARAIWGLAAKGATGVHHFTDAGAISWYDFAVAVAEEGAARGLCPANVAVVPITTEDYPTPAQRPAYSVLDKSATWALLGGPARHWREELRDTLDQVRTNG
jgi:dTDP-4-dehydrorhamnose reductase